MPTPDSKDWLLNDADWARVEDMDGGVHDADNIARAQLLKALKGVEEWLRDTPVTIWIVFEGKRMPIPSDGGLLALLADDLAAARARLESEGKA